MERDAGVPLRPVVICGPSGVGKGTLIAKLMARACRPAVVSLTSFSSG